MDRRGSDIPLFGNFYSEQALLEIRHSKKQTQIPQLTGIRLIYLHAVAQLSPSVSMNSTCTSSSISSPTPKEVKRSTPKSERLKVALPENPTV